MAIEGCSRQIVGFAGRRVSGTLLTLLVLIVLDMVLKPGL